MKRLKRLFAPLLLVLSVPFYVNGQGSFWFNNIDGSPDIAPVTISSSTGAFNPADGLGGAYVGSDYTASAYYLNGIVTDQAVFDNSNPILFAPADTLFFGATGFAPAHGPSSDEAGLFNHVGPATLPTFGEGPGNVTVQVRAWYNGGGLYTSYDQALAAGQNVGESIPVSLLLSFGASPPEYMNGLLPFTVGIAPEPSTFALFSLGSLALWQFARRRK
jgi:hypothetical protein